MELKHKKAGEILNRVELGEEEFDCKKHGRYKGIPFRLNAFNIRIDPQCPECLKAIAAEETAAEIKRRDERRRAGEEERLKAMNIGSIFFDESFETFDACSAELQGHLKTCKDFAENPQGRLLFMLGNNGTGKNHLAASILKITGGVLYTVFEIEVKLRQSYSGDTQEEKVLSCLCDVKMLVIDEIGRTKGGNWEQNWLSHVVNKRYVNLMPTVLISNKHLKEDCPDGGCPDCIQYWVGNDVLSRIKESGIIMEFTGEDYRPLKRLQRIGRGQK